MKESLGQHGFAISAPLLDEAECALLESRLHSLTNSMAPSQAGTRSLLSLAWCAQLAQSLRDHPELHAAIPVDYVAVQCTLFEKSAERNWLVSYHRDLSIPVAQRLEHPALKVWSEKEGALYVQPPFPVLNELVALRLHVDACSADDGPLRVIPATHLQELVNSDDISRMKEREQICVVARGAAMLMRPTLLHASSRSTGTSRRRVLHFLYAPRQLAFGLRWHQAVP